jgi:hypothetical protein
MSLECSPVTCSGVGHCTFFCHVILSDSGLFFGIWKGAVLHPAHSSCAIKRLNTRLRATSLRFLLCGDYTRARALSKQQAATISTRQAKDEAQNLHAMQTVPVTWKMSINNSKSKSNRQPGKQETGHAIHHLDDNTDVSSVFGKYLPTEQFQYRLNESREGRGDPSNKDSFAVIARPSSNV